MRGRPTVYTQELIDAANKYVDGGWIECGDRVPTVAGLACELGICRDTCYAWGEDDEKQDFSDILSKILQKQERELVNKGLDGTYNAPITKMMLTKHGYSDAVDNRLSSPDGSMTPKGLDASKLSNEALAEIMAANDASKSG